MDRMLYSIVDLPIYLQHYLIFFSVNILTHLTPRSILLAEICLAKIVH